MQQFFSKITSRIKKRLVIASVLFWIPILLFIELAEDILDKESILFDVPIMDFVKSLNNDGLDVLMKIVTHGGDMLFIIISLAILSVFLYSKKRQRDLIAVLFSVGGAGVINLALKLLFTRQRPELELALVSESSFSFPSGHAMGSAALGLVLITMFWRSGLRWFVFALSSFYIFVIGLSRIYLGVHYPSDVLAGWCVSAVWALVVYIVLEHPTSIKRYLQKLRNSK